MIAKLINHGDTEATGKSNLEYFSVISVSAWLN